MKLNCVFKISNGKYCCEYICVKDEALSKTLKRVVKAKTKADENRFAEYIYINILGESLGSIMIKKQKIIS